MIAPNSGGKTSILDAIKSLLIALIHPDTDDIYKQNDQRKENNFHLTNRGLLALKLSIQKNYLHALGFKRQYYVETNQDNELLAISSPYAYQALLAQPTKDHLLLFAQWLRERELSGLEARLEMEQEGETGIPEPNPSNRSFLYFSDDVKSRSGN